MPSHVWSCCHLAALSARQEIFRMSMRGRRRSGNDKVRPRWQVLSLRGMLVATRRQRRRTLGAVCATFMTATSVPTCLPGRTISSWKSLRVAERIAHGLVSPFGGSVQWRMSAEVPVFARQHQTPVHGATPDNRHAPDTVSRLHVVERRRVTARKPNGNGELCRFCST